MTAQAAPRPQHNPDPDHAHDHKGTLAYDLRCYWCRQLPLTPPPTAKTEETDRS